MGGLVRSSGVWKSETGVFTNFVYFKQGAEDINISSVYLDLTSIQSLGCTAVNAFNFTKPYIRILDCLEENPKSLLAKEIFGSFLQSLQVETVDEVKEIIKESSTLDRLIDIAEDTKEPDFSFSHGGLFLQTLQEGGSKLEDGVHQRPERDHRRPEDDVKIDIKIHSDEEYRDDEDDRENQYYEDLSFDGSHVEENVEGEEKGAIRKYEKRKPYPPTLSEKRFLDRCSQLGECEDLEVYFSSPNLDLGAITCFLCKKELTSSIVQRASLRICLIDRVVDHILVKHFKTYAYQCQVCQTTFNSPKPWKDHVKTNCDKRMLSNLGKFVCKKCKQRFETKTELYSHVSTCHDQYLADLLICSSCGLMFKTGKCRSDHEKKFHKIANNSFKKKPSKRDRNLPNGGAPRVLCPTCGFECCTKWVLENHMRKWHENAFAEPKICELCVKPDSSNFSRRKYYTPYSLEKHKSEYHGAECHEIICEHCSKVFKGGINQAKRSLKTHIDKVHLGIKYSCDQCNKEFLTDKTLSSHKRHVHRKEGNYPCKECGKVFGYYLQAVEHAYKDRGEAPHQCKFCDFRSAHSWALAKHRPVCKYKGISKELAGEIQQRELLLAQGDIQQRDLLQGEIQQRELLILAQGEIQQRELLHNHDQQRDIISREHHKFVTRDFMQHRLHM